jgi:hypothetical protein
MRIPSWDCGWGRVCARIRGYFFTKPRPRRRGFIFPTYFGSRKKVNEMTAALKTFATPVDLYRAISRVWSGDTSSPTNAWSPSNVAQNHCSVTSLIVHDHFGGEILTTQTSGGRHFYNLIDGRKWDLTARQFAEPVPYDDTRSSREEALADTSPQKYSLLTSRLREAIR